MRARLLLLGMLFSAGVAYATDFAPHNMTSDSLPTPLGASASSEYTLGGNYAYLAFDGSYDSTHEWLGTGSGTDSLTLDLGTNPLTDFAPHNMTGNEAPSPYLAYASSSYNPAYKAFDGNAGDPWQGQTGGTGLLQIDLGAGLTLISSHAMTSNSAPSPFVASASSSYGGGYEAYRAFDASTNYWIGTGSGVDWLELDLGSGNAQILGAYDIRVNNIPEPNRAPKNWTMQGSNDNSTWTTVDTRTNQTSWGNFQSRAYIPSTQTTAYRYFRLNISANNGDATYTQVSDLWLYAAGTSTTAQPLKQYQLKFSTNGAEPTGRGPKNWTMLGSNDGNTWTTLDTQTNQTGWSAGLLRTYTLSSLSAAYRFYQINITANNGDGTYITIGQMYLYSAAAVNPYAKHLLSYAIEFSTTGAEPVNRAPKTWTMQGSNDQVTWDTLDTQSSQTGWSTGEIRTFNCASPTGTSYEYFKLNVTANNGDATYTGLSEMYLYDVAMVVATARHKLLFN